MRMMKPLPLIVGLGLRPQCESRSDGAVVVHAPGPRLQKTVVALASTNGAPAEGGGGAQGGNFDQVMDVVDVAFTEVLGEEEREKQGQKLSILSKSKNMLLRAVRSRGEDKGFLAKHGVSALISYGFISHITYGACIAIAWVATGLRSGLSPFAPGQWTPFFAAYLALCASVFWLRPFRIALSLFLAPKVCHDHLTTGP